MPRLPLLLLVVLSSVACHSTRLVGHDLKAVGKAPAEHWKKVAAGAVVVGAALLVDDEVAAVTRNNDSHAMDQVTKVVEPFGGGASDKVIGAFLLYGVAAKNDTARAVAFDSIVSSVLASKVITPLLKELTDRERPNGGDPDAFPSNHTTQAFAVASVIASHYGNERPWVRWVAYGLATGVGVSRIYHDAHWTSDVIAGAAIGSLVGHTVARTNRGIRAEWQVQPVIESDRKGALFSMRW